MALVVIKMVTTKPNVHISFLKYLWLIMNKLRILTKSNAHILFLKFVDELWENWETLQYWTWFHNNIL